MFTLLIAGAAHGGGSPMRTLIVVNQNSDRSLELGRYYAEKRGIPERQIFSISVVNNIEIDTAGYSNQIRAPVLAYLSASGLTNQIDTIVFSMDVPYRVYRPPYGDYRWAGLTAAMSYGFYSSPNPFVFDCSLAAGSASAYFETERAFRRGTGLPESDYYLCAMLTAANLGVAKRLVDRSVFADYSSPTSQVYLLRTEDLFRYVQWEEFENTIFMGRFLDAPEETFWIDANTISGKTNVIGMTAGRKLHEFLAQNVITPGAIGDHLTSYGGYLIDPKPDTIQMTILEWIYNGFSGSYGTVVEPCAYTNKFPSPRYHYWYERGFSLGESLSMSIQNPYQGVIVGDPLCAPFASAATVQWIGVTNGHVVSGSLSLTGQVLAASAAHPASEVDWFRDGILQSTVTNAAPGAGNILSVTISGTTRSYTVKPGDTLRSVVTGLVAAINKPPPLGVTAVAHGDRIEIRQNALGVGAVGLSCSASVATGTAAALTTHLSVPFTNFQETAFAARRGLELSGDGQSGDVVRLVITRLDGLVITNDYSVTNDVGNNYTTMNGVMASINNNTNLQSSVGCFAKYRVPEFTVTKTNGVVWLFSRTNTWEGYNLYADYQFIRVSNSTLGVSNVFNGYFDGNANVMSARATVFVSAGETQLTAVASMNTTNWPDGPHVLTLASREGTAVGTESRASVIVNAKNHDLVCSVDSPVDRTYRLKSGAVTVDVTTAVSIGAVTQIILYAEGKAAATGTASTLSVELPLASFGAGPLHLQALASADAGRATLSEVATVFLYTDLDADGISDQWEYENFGAFTNVAGDIDTDQDGYPNYDEFVADTQPTNSASYFRVSGFTDTLSLSFPSSAERVYRIRLNDQQLDGDLWYPAGGFFAGSNSVITWTDSPSNAPSGTNEMRYYAVEPALPK